MFFFPAMVVAALNIENVAAALGIDKLFTTRWSAVNSLTAFLLSDAALHIALFVAGGGAFAWGSLILRKVDEGVPGLGSMSLTCAELGELYGDTKRFIGTRRFIERTMERRTEKLNKKLAYHEIAPVPFPDLASGSSRLHVAQYLNGLALFLKKKDVEGARKLEVVYLRNLEAVGFVSRPLPDTGEETPP